MDRPQNLVRELRRRPLLSDGLLALVLTAVDLGFLVAMHQQSARSMGPIAVMLVLLQTAPLVLRRRAPVPVFFLVGAARVTFDVIGFSFAPQPLGVLVALYGVSGMTGRPWRRVVLGSTAAGFAISMSAHRPKDIPVEAALNGLLLATAWVMGDNARTRRAYISEVEARATQAELAKESAARQAALEERARIARELHDVVAHHLSVIAVRSEAAAALLPVDPTRAEEVVTSVGSTARQALGEMRQLLGVLRRPDTRAELAPQPGLTDLDGLLAEVRRAGLTVEVEEAGAARSLPPAVDLTCYRIVQEALTNVLKHAGPASVWVRVDWRPDGVALDVQDDGCGPAGLTARDVGHGLAGMQERVATLGGRLRAAGRTGEGFTVSAWLPTPGQ